MRRKRAVAQLLHRPGGLTAEAAVRHLLAVQAQDARSARLALLARGAGDPLGCDALAVTWLLRGTLHLVHVDDLAWLHALTAPPARAGNRRRLARLGVPDDTTARLRAALPFHRDDVPGLLGLRGQAVPHALLRAALDGVLVADLAGRFRAWEPEPIDREAALAELARRYGAAHPGATRADLARWAGLPLRDCAEPGPADAASRRTGARLLGAYDPYLLGWRDRSFAVPEALAGRVFAGGGTFRATAVVDGRVVGTWSGRGGRVRLDVTGDPGAFAAEVARVEALLGVS